MGNSECQDDAGCDEISKLNRQDLFLSFVVEVLTMVVVYLLTVEVLALDNGSNLKVKHGKILQVGWGIGCKVGAAANLHL